MEVTQPGHLSPVPNNAPGGGSGTHVSTPSPGRPRRHALRHRNGESHRRRLQAVRFLANMLTTSPTTGSGCQRRRRRQPSTQPPMYGHALRAFCTDRLRRRSPAATSHEALHYLIDSRLDTRRTGEDLSSVESGCGGDSPLGPLDARRRLVARAGTSSSLHWRRP